MENDTNIIVSRVREVATKCASTYGFSTDDIDALRIAASVIEGCANTGNENPVLTAKVESLMAERDDLARALETEKDHARYLYQEKEVNRAEIRILSDRIDDLQSALATISIQYANRITASQQSIAEIRLSNARREAGEDFDSENEL